MAGIEEIIFITSHTKRSIENHFEKNEELEEKLLNSGNKDVIKKINRDIFQDVKFTYIRQKFQKGLGDAILQASHLIEDEYFAILLADDLIVNNPSATQQLINVAKETNTSVIGLNRVPEEHINRYGVISFADSSKNEKLFHLNGIIEKPKSNPPSDMVVFGRYVLSHHIFDYLEHLEPGFAGEIQLTDAIKLMLKDHNINGYLYDGIKFDCGSKEGYVQAIAHLASDMISK
tara:strand:- start:345 stop:1040 length:696 start_codon:yes stop_codon:yes gene_type:complete